MMRVIPRRRTPCSSNPTTGKQDSGKSLSGFVLELTVCSNKGCGNVLTSLAKENECLRKGHRVRCQTHGCTYIDFCIKCRNVQRRKESQERQKRLEALEQRRHACLNAATTDFDRGNEGKYSVYGQTSMTLTASVTRLATPRCRASQRNIKLSHADNIP